MDNWVYQQRLTLLMSKHQSDFDYACVDNWSGVSSVAVTPSVINYAFFLAVCIDEAPAEVSPNQDGSLAFSWELDLRGRIYLDVGPGKFVHALIHPQNQPAWEKVVRWDDKTLLSKLEAICPGFHDLYESKKPSWLTQAIPARVSLPTTASPTSLSGSVSLSIATSPQKHIHLELCG